MKIDTLRDLTMDALALRFTELSEELFRLRFQHGIRPLDNTAKIKQVRRDIARVKTVMNSNKFN